MSMVDPKRQTQGDKDATELIKAYNPPKNKRNTSEDKRNILQKVADEGVSAGGRPGGTPSDPDGSGTGDSDKCTGCDKAGDIGCELGKLSCEFTSSMGEMGIPAILIGALIIFIVIAVK